MVSVSVYEVHALLQVIAFGVLFPTGALIAAFRESIGESWRKWHVGIQLTAVALVFVAVTIVHLGDGKKEKEDDKKNKTTDTTNWLRFHKIVGPIVVLLILVQLVWAFFARQLVVWGTWLHIHMLLSGAIITLGLANVYIGWRMTRVH
jgi:SNF family Na+-dependent transporter